jgi:hypothetical protein
VTDTGDPRQRNSLAAAAELVMSLEGAERLPSRRFLKYLADYDVAPDLVADVLSVHNPELVQSRMSELEHAGWDDIESSDPDELMGVDPVYARYWDQVQQRQRLIVILERAESDPLGLGGYAVRGPAQWLIESIWRATGVTPINPGNSDNDAFVSAWQAAHTSQRPTEPDQPFDFVPLGAGIARMATRREVFSALLWPVPKGLRTGALPVMVVSAALLAAIALWLIGIGPFWALTIYTLAAAILAMIGWIAFSAWRLSKPAQWVLISTTDDAIIGLKIVRDAIPHVEIHTHYASPVGSSAGRRFREALVPHVKEFVTTLEPGMPIKIKCPSALWRRLRDEVGREFADTQGWRVARAGTTTMIYPPTA